MEAVTPFIEVPRHGYHVYVGAVPIENNDEAFITMAQSVESFLRWRITRGHLKFPVGQTYGVEKAKFIMGRMTADKQVAFEFQDRLFLAGYALLSDSDTIEYRMRFE